MIYSRCFYMVLIVADEAEKSKHPTTRSQVMAHFRNAARLLDTQISTLTVGSGFVMFLADLNVLYSINDFVARVKNHTSQKIINSGGDEVVSSAYWSSRSYYRPVSPEDKSMAESFIASASQYDDFESLAGICRMHAVEDGGNNGTTGILHHIILITSRARQLLREKYRYLLADITCDVSNRLGAQAVAAGARRNHVHLLAYVPSDESMSHFTERLKESLLEAMHANIHFRSFDGWDADTILFAVAEKRKPDEQRSVLIQDQIHATLSYGNEMTYIYQKLSITYVTSLR